MRKRIEVTNGDDTEPDMAQENGHSGDSAQNVGGDTDAPAPDGVFRDSSTGAQDYVTALQAELEDVRARLEEAEKRVLYVQAEFQNYRRRRDEEQAGLQKFMNREMIVGLLPVMDNFERAFKAAEQSRNIDALVSGVASTLKQFQAFLEKSGVKPIDAVGKEFNPNFHEAIGHSDTPDVPANTVSEEVQRGYTMHDRVLRPSLVKVSQG